MKKEEQSPPLVEPPQETTFESTSKSEQEEIEHNQNDSGSMVEEVEMGAGCVADMHKTANPKPSQQELQLNDILNSPMLNKAKELFDIKKITVKSRS